MPDITTRTERPEDHAAVRAVNRAAFEQDAEADLVDALRAACPSHLSIVAEVEGVIAGHILFTPAAVEHGGDRLECMGLAPMAVLPGRQRGGIGSALVEAGLARLRGEACPFVIVLGHPGYYPRFGFVPASRFGIRCQWEAPDEAFMAIELTPGVLAGFAGGMARYHPVFDGME